LFQFGGGRNCIIFTKIWTKLRQKIKEGPNWEWENDTSQIVTRGTVTATWHDVSLTRGKIVIFLKNLKKIQKNSKKNSKKNQKKNKKIQKI